MKAPAYLLKCIVKLSNKIIESKKAPPACSTVNLIMLHNKGDVKDPVNYRDIALVNQIVKIFTHIMADRLYTWATAHIVLPEEQSGFGPGREYTDNIFTLSSAIQLQLRLQR